MDFRPILSTLRRHKTAAALIVLEVALTCAIVCNAVFLIGSRIERMGAQTGLAEAELLRIQLAGIGNGGNADVVTRQDLISLRALAGVKGAAIVNQVPFGTSSSNTSINLAPDQKTATLQVSLYMADEALVDAMGLRLIEGRNFLPAEVQPQSITEREGELKLPAVLLTKSTAERLFPGKSAVGQVIYSLGESPTRVVGVVEQLAPPRPLDRSEQHAIILPLVPSHRSGSFLVRVDPSQRTQVLKAAVDALERNDSRRIVLRQERLEDMREAYYQQDRWMAGLLVAVCVALLVVTAFGIVGLASFWVQQRTRMIGVRRALGASRSQILQYFQAENFLLTSIGIALGMIGAFGINQLMMSHYELPRLPWQMLPIGALSLWTLGQIAVLGPALRAAALPPVVVMRGA